MLMLPSTRGFVGAGAPMSALDPNFCAPAVVLSNNNMTAATVSQSFGPGGSVIGTKGAASGKRYFEVNFDVITGGGNGLGVFAGVVSTNYLRTGGVALNLGTGYPGIDTYSFGFGQWQGQTCYEAFGSSNNFQTGLFAASPGGSVAMVAVDLTGGAIWFGIDGHWALFNPLEGRGGDYNYSTAAAPALWPCVYVLPNPNNGQVTFNPGPTFHYPPPSGFSAWGAGDGTGAFVSTPASGGVG